MSNPIWNNCVKAAANIEGSPYREKGYKAFDGESVAGEKLTASGNYILRVSYKDSEGNSFMMIVELTV